MRTFYDFFAGGGMARVGLGPGWTCQLANDIDPMKGGAYRANFDGQELKDCDVAELTMRDLPGRVGCAWMSPPCQDLKRTPRASASTADARAPSGCAGDILRLSTPRAAPLMTVLENVPKLPTKNDGRDIAAICAAYEHQEYSHVTIKIDAQHFVPQERERAFIIGAHRSLGVPPSCLVPAFAGAGSV
jgi:DNA (cytosine-5)-methyltransferase 1